MSEEKPDPIKATLERLEEGFSRLDAKVSSLDTDVRIVSDRVDTYQKEST